MIDAAEKVQRIERALSALVPHQESCRLCPRECGVSRAAGERGFCGSSQVAAVSHALLHYGEEPALSGLGDVRGDGEKKDHSRAGSGAIFFTGCNLKCLFCQNYQLSWLHQGEEVDDNRLAELMLGLEAAGAWNINLVSPTHQLLPILRALRLAYRKGLSIPLVYNSNAYEKAEVLSLLDGIVDIYLPDLKYFDPEVSAKYSGAADYFRFAGPAIQEMFMQRPSLRLSEAGIAQEGLIVRHLVLPGRTKDSQALLRWLADEVNPAVALSLMSQYHPCFRAPSELRRTLQPQEYREVLAEADRLGFETMFVQPALFAPEDHLIPDFTRKEPFVWSRKLGTGEG